MNDTHHRAAAKMKELMQKKSPEERLVMGCAMFDFSKQLVITSISKNKSHLSLPALRKELFLRFYGIDFDSEKQAKILSHLIHTGA